MCLKQAVNMKIYRCILVKVVGIVSRQGLTLFEKVELVG